MGSRRGKGTQVPSKTTSDIDLSTAGPSGTTVVLAESIPLEDTEFLAIKLNRSIDKVTRYESHQEYLTACIRDKLIPTNFKIEIEPSIGNHSEAFLTTWYDKIQKLSMDLMKDTVKFCEKTVAETKTEIKTLEDEIKNQADPEEYVEIKTTITKYNEQKIKELHRTKTEKHRKLRWNLTSRQTKQQPNREQRATTREKTKQQPYSQRLQQNLRDEPAAANEALTRTTPRTYADILKPKSNNMKTAQHIAEHSDNNNPERDPKTTGKQMQMPTRETPTQQSQTERSTKSYKY